LQGLEAVRLEKKEKIKNIKNLKGINLKAAPYAADPFF
jgi:hypothetical protein